MHVCACACMRNGLKMGLAGWIAVACILCWSVDDLSMVWAGEVVSDDSRGNSDTDMHDAD